MTTSPLKTPSQVLRVRELNSPAARGQGGTSPGKDEVVSELTATANSPRSHSTEISRVFGRLVGRADSRVRTVNAQEDNREKMVIGPKRSREEPHFPSPARKLFRSGPSPKLPTPSRKTPAASRTTPTRSSASPANLLPVLPPLPDSPLEVDLTEFDKLFADFPLPTSDSLTLKCSAGSSKSRLETALNTLEGVWSELRNEVKAEEERNGRTYLLEKEVQRTKAQVDHYRRRVQELEGLLEREKAERGKAAMEARGMMAHLEKRLAKEQEDRASQLHFQHGSASVPYCWRTLADLPQKAAEEALTHRQHSEATSDRRLFELQQQIDAALQTISRTESTFRAREEQLLIQAKQREEDLHRQAREKEREWKGRLEEADFAHRALKEGGARLARELERRGRALDDLERRAKGFV